MRVGFTYLEIFQVLAEFPVDGQHRAGQPPPGDDRCRAGHRDHVRGDVTLCQRLSTPSRRLGSAMQISRRLGALIAVLGVVCVAVMDQTTSGMAASFVSKDVALRLDLRCLCVGCVLQGAHAGGGQAGAGAGGHADGGPVAAAGPRLPAPRRLPARRPVHRHQVSCDIASTFSPANFVNGLTTNCIRPPGTARCCAAHCMTARVSGSGAVDSARMIITIYDLIISSAGWRRRGT